MPAGHRGRWRGSDEGGVTMTDLIDPTRAQKSLGSESGPEPAAMADGAPSLPAPLMLRMTGGARMDAAQFFEFCQQNENYRIERSAAGEVTLVPPAGPPA